VSRRLRFLVPVLLAVVVAALAGAARADNPQLVADVGLNDSFSISLKDETGAPVTHLDPGTYTLLVHDHSSLHDFHLFGNDLNVATDVTGVGDSTFTIALTDGVYRFVCDPHSSVMKGSFTVGTAATPSPPQPPQPAPTPVTPVHRLTVGLGSGAHVVLRGAAGLTPGKVVIVVKDPSRTDNVRLTGPGVNRATGIAFRGTVTWKVTLRNGTYALRSDRHPKVRRTFVVATG
jgi:plastocyanin